MMQMMQQVHGKEPPTKFVSRWAESFQDTTPDDDDYEEKAGATGHIRPQVRQMRRNLVLLSDNAHNVHCAHGKHLNTWGSRAYTVFLRMTENHDAVIQDDKDSFVTRANLEVEQLIALFPDSRWIDIDLRGGSKHRVRRVGHQARKRAHGGGGMRTAKKRFRGRDVNFGAPAVIAKEKERASHHRARLLKITVEIQVCGCPEETHAHKRGEKMYDPESATDSDNETDTDSDSDAHKSDSDSD